MLLAWASVMQFLKLNSNDADMLFILEGKTILLASIPFLPGGGWGGGRVRLHGRLHVYLILDLISLA